MSMGVYIKGMEMPIDCLHCCFASGCSYCEGYNDQCTFEPDDIKTDWDFAHGVFPGSIPDWCPLVPIPPHGRLGDLDNFALLVLNWISTQEKAYPHEDSNALAWRLGAKAMANQIYRDINAYPTIIPAEGGE